MFSLDLICEMVITFATVNISLCHLVTAGMPVTTVAIVEWRNGPQGLHYDDDDDDDHEYFITISLPNTCWIALAPIFAT